MLNGFVGEFLILLARFSSIRVCDRRGERRGARGAYMLWMFRRVMFGGRQPENRKLIDLDWREKACSCDRDPDRLDRREPRSAAAPRRAERLGAAPGRARAVARVSPAPAPKPSAVALAAGAEYSDESAELNLSVLGRSRRSAPARCSC